MLGELQADWQEEDRKKMALGLRWIFSGRMPIKMRANPDIPIRRDSICGNEAGTQVRHGSGVQNVRLDHSSLCGEDERTAYT
jgi:hypothetical protein